MSPVVWDNMLLFLPSELFHAIVARLNPHETRMLAGSSKKVANKVWRRVRFSLKDFRCTLEMFRPVDSVLPDDALVRKVTRIARNPFRVLALFRWIRSQSVGIDAGGFFAFYRANIRIRIGLWDRPLGVRYVYGANYSTEPVVFLRRGFAHLAYDA